MQSRLVILCQVGYFMGFSPHASYCAEIYDAKKFDDNKELEKTIEKLKKLGEKMPCIVYFIS